LLRRIDPPAPIDIHRTDPPITFNLNIGCDASIAVDCIACQREANGDHAFTMT
jgi:hypothetical protein